MQPHTYTVKNPADLILLLLAATQLSVPTFAFQALSKGRCNRLPNLTVKDLAESPPAIRSSTALALNDHDSHPDETHPKETNELPFFARMVKKVMRKREHEEETIKSLTIDAIEASNKATRVESQNSDGDLVMEASRMKALAERTRLEAQRDEMVLTMDKISNLEIKPSQIQIEDAVAPAKLRQEIIDAVCLLRSRLDPSEIKSTKQTRLIPQKSKVKSDGDTLPQPLGEDKREDAITGFSNLPSSLQDVLAKSVALPPGSNATAVIDKLMAEGKLAASYGDFTFKTTLKKQDLDKVFVDGEK